MQEIINKLKVESTELHQKISNLYCFMGSDAFNKIEFTQQNLLRIQYTTMESYYNILQLRLNLLNDRNC